MFRKDRAGGVRAQRDGFQRYGEGMTAIGDNGVDLEHVTELCNRVRGAVASYEAINNPNGARSVPAGLETVLALVLSTRSILASATGPDAAPLHDLAVATLAENLSRGPDEVEAFFDGCDRLEASNCVDIHTVEPAGGGPLQ